MAEEKFYSALHWAKKAEASAKLAAENAQSGGALLQLGFDGSLVNGVLEFKHAPGGVEVSYTLVNNVEYELDLAFSSTATLPADTQMVIKNGNDTIRFVSALHREATTNATVADMDAVMRFNSSTGYRWLFKAAYKVTPSGAKVFLLYPVAYKDDSIVKTSGDQTIAGTKTFKDMVVAEKDFFRRATNITLGTAPSSNQYASYKINDKNDKQIANFYASQTTTNNMAANMIATNVNSSTGASFDSAIRVVATSSGERYTEAPTPAASDNSTKIATTAWVNTRLGGTKVTSTELGYLDGVTSAIQTQLNGKQATLTSGTNIKTINSTSLLGSGNIAITSSPITALCTTKATTTSSASSTKPAVVVTNYVNGTTWYRIWSDGWKEQGGEFTFTADENTITLPKAFSNTNYNIQVTQRCNNNATWENNVRVKSKTSASAFVVRGEVNTAASHGFYWYACGY